MKLIDTFLRLIKDPRNLAIFLLFVIIFSAGVGWYGASHIGTLSVDSVGTSDYIFAVASSTGDTAFVVANNENVGVNTLAPATNLDVQGTLRARIAFPPVCTQDIEGAITYDRLARHFVGCTDHGWVRLDN
jgi:hypothetical protein